MAYQYLYLYPYCYGSIVMARATWKSPGIWWILESHYPVGRPTHNQGCHHHLFLGVFSPITFLPFRPSIFPALPFALLFSVLFPFAAKRPLKSSRVWECSKFSRGLGGPLSQVHFGVFLEPGERSCKCVDFCLTELTRSLAIAKRPCNCCIILKSGSYTKAWPYSADRPISTKSRA